MTNIRHLVRILPDSAQLATAAAEQIIGIAGAAVRRDGRFCFALAGGSTPRELYALLATAPYAGRLEWPLTHVFWGDERGVPPDHPDSNYGMAREALLSHVALPADNIHRIAGEREPAQAAALYEQHLRVYFGEQARFDLILLGIGSDGHTASLFPHSPALHERERWVVATEAPEAQPAARITLTPPVINAAAQVLFLVSGVEKAATLRRVLSSDTMPDELPAQVVQPAAGAPLWLVDEAAASQLSPPPKL